MSGPETTRETEQQRLGAFFALGGFPRVPPHDEPMACREAWLRGYDEAKTTDVILPAPRDPIPYDEWKRALDQISAALRPHGLVLTVHIVDGSFSVERLPHD